MTTEVLVDYDNIDPLFKNRGLVDVVERICHHLPSAGRPPSLRLHFRLYGGWFLNNNSTQLAQKLATEIAADFPRAFAPMPAGSPGWTLSADLALASLFEPTLALTHTFRPRAQLKGVTCKPGAIVSCGRQPNCALTHLPSFINNSVCGVNGCPITPADVLGKNEQKLVDSLLLADLVYLHSTGHTPLVLVSNDDDMIPGIRLVLAQGAKLVHIHPTAGRTTPRHYARGVNPNDYATATLT